MAERLLEKKEKLEIELGLYAVNGFLILTCILWTKLDEPELFALVNVIFNMVFLFYSFRLMREYADTSFNNKFIRRFIICNFVCLFLYSVELKYGINRLCIIFVAMYGFCFSYFSEVWKLVQKANEIQHKIENIEPNIKENKENKEKKVNKYIIIFTHVLAGLLLLFVIVSPFVYRISSGVSFLISSFCVVIEFIIAKKK